MKLAFAGTPAFARTALAALHGAGHEIACVLTQPDRPSGRGMKTAPSPVKVFAVEAGIAVLQPRGLRGDGRYAEDAAAAAQALEEAAPEAIVVAAYGLILPRWLLDQPRHGCINVHASLLPRWRGAAPVQRAIDAGDAETGVTLMQMDEGLDTGAMLMLRATPIGAGDTAATLTERLAHIGAALAVDGLAALGRGETLPRRVQPAAGVTYAAKIGKDESAIDWHRPAVAIERRLRAFDPFPGARGALGGEAITCWRGEALPRAEAALPGTVVAVSAEGPVVACGEGSIRLIELQRAGGRRLPAAEFLRGRPVAAGDRFGAVPPDAGARDGG